MKYFCLTALEGVSASLKRKTTNFRQRISLTKHRAICDWLHYWFLHFLLKALFTVESLRQNLLLVSLWNHAAAITPTECTSMLFHHSGTPTAARRCFLVPWQHIHNKRVVLSAVWKGFNCACKSCAVDSSVFSHSWHHDALRYSQLDEWSNTKQNGHAMIGKKNQSPQKFYHQMSPNKWHKKIATKNVEYKKK